MKEEDCAILSHALRCEPLDTYRSIFEKSVRLVKACKCSKVQVLESTKIAKTLSNESESHENARRNSTDQFRHSMEKKCDIATTLHTRETHVEQRCRLTTTMAAKKTFRSRKQNEDCCIRPWPNSIKWQQVGGGYTLAEQERNAVRPLRHNSRILGMLTKHCT